MRLLSETCQVVHQHIRAAEARIVLALAEGSHFHWIGNYGAIDSVPARLYSATVSRIFPVGPHHLHLLCTCIDSQSNKTFQGSLGMRGAVNPFAFYASHSAKLERAEKILFLPFR
jgi:hypothetical protein